MTLNIPIFYEGNDDLIEILATSMCSICYNTESFINFYSRLFITELKPELNLSEVKLTKTTYKECAIELMEGLKKIIPPKIMMLYHSKKELLLNIIAMVTKFGVLIFRRENENRYS